jgi:hypothetical protein
MLEEAHIVVYLEIPKVNMLLSFLSSLYLWIFFLLYLIKKMNYLQFVKQWRTKNAPTMSWKDAMRNARRFYYQDKEQQVPTLYSPEAGDSIDRSIFDSIKESGYQPEIFEFRPKGKKFDRDVYLVEGEKTNPEQLQQLRKKMKSKKGKDDMNYEIQALMNLPTVDRPLKAKKPRPIGIRKVGKIKNAAMKLMKNISKQRKQKGMKGLTKGYARKFIKKALILKTLEGRK